MLRWTIIHMTTMVMSTLIHYPLFTIQDSINPQPTVITSPIVSAILGGNSECVRLLVEAGASVNSASGITDNM